MKRTRWLLIALIAFALPLVAAEDAHFIQSDDFFFSESELGENAWMYVHLGKMLTAPSAQTKGQAQFLRVTDGKKIWTTHFARTRIATEQDLKLNQEIIIFETSEDDVYIAPRTKSEAREGHWFLAVITDTSDLFKNQVTTSGGYKVATSNIRIKIDEKSGRAVEKSL